MEKNSKILIVLLLVSTVLLGLLIAFDLGITFVYITLTWMFILVILGMVLYGVEQIEE